MSASATPIRIPEAVIRLDSMPATGRDLVLEVAADARAEIAALVDVTDVPRLEVTLRAVRFRGGIRVTGRLFATVIQPSVVTLEPVTQEIAEAIDRVFLPSGGKELAVSADAEIFVDLDGEDIPDHFEGNEADLSDLIVETLSLAIDPYPRAPGESLGVSGDAIGEDERPFAALAALKTPHDGS